MRNKLLSTALGLGLALGIGFASAQVITKAIQLSQDATGIVPVDSNNGIYFPGHILSPTSGPGVRPLPSVGTCGTSPSVVGTDLSGKVTTGSTATTSCVVTFGTAYVTAPACVVSPDSSMAVTTAVSGVSTTTTLTVTYTSSTSSKFDYICVSTS